eukprot:TRINITY_DN36_c1_g3_i2.p1 TRINITY_DN36_c1_g3~~TRINITY_DN36_c1_g3_i2.p1  ORF type:complete len:562 (-),score=136.94 TRINITY_DN36_c1_g3_i2:8-1501(-)
MIKETNGAKQTKENETNIAIGSKTIEKSTGKVEEIPTNIDTETSAISPPPTTTTAEITLTPTTTTKPQISQEKKGKTLTFEIESLKPEASMETALKIIGDAMGTVDSTSNTQAQMSKTELLAKRLEKSHISSSYISPCKTYTSEMKKKAEESKIDPFASPTAFFGVETSEDPFVCFYRIGRYGICVDKYDSVVCKRPNHSIFSLEQSPLLLQKLVKQIKESESESESESKSDAIKSNGDNNSFEKSTKHPLSSFDQQITVITEDEIEQTKKLSISEMTNVITDCRLMEALFVHLSTNFPQTEYGNDFISVDTLDDFLEQDLGIEGTDNVADIILGIDFKFPKDEMGFVNENVNYLGFKFILLNIAYRLFFKTKPLSFNNDNVNDLVEAFSHFFTKKLIPFVSRFGKSVIHYRSVIQHSAIDFKSFSSEIPRQITAMRRSILSIYRALYQYERSEFGKLKPAESHDIPTKQMKISFCTFLLWLVNIKLVRYITRDIAR